MRPRYALAGRLVLAALMVPVVVFSNPTQAAASSLSGIATNTWIVSDLAVQVASTGYSPVTEAEAIKYGSATVATKTAGGLKPAPRPGVAGMLINSVAVLGGLALLWPGGEEGAPELPAPGGGSQTVVNAPWLTVSNVIVEPGRIHATLRVAPGYAMQGVDWPGANCQHTTTGANRLPDFFGAGSGFGPQTGGKTVTYEERSSCALDHIFTAHSVRIGAKDPNGVMVPQGVWQPLGKDAPQGGDPILTPRYIDSTATCTSAGGGTQTITHREGPFTFDPAMPNAPLPDVPDLVCPEGTWLSSGTRELATEGSTVTVPLTEPYTAPAWVEEQATNFPECFPIGSVACMLQLFKVTVEVGSNLNCNTAGAPGSEHACRDWFSDPNKQSKYECRFGANVVALKQCEPFAQSFSTGTLTATPEVETELPPPGGDPTPEATPNLGTCTPEWADLLTPWWVFKAMSCALEWAFVPDPSSWGWETVVEQAQTRPPASLFVGLGEAASSVRDGYASAGGCGVMADFTSADISATLNCQAVKSTPGYGALYALMTAALYIVTGLGLFKLFSGLMQDGQ